MEEIDFVITWVDGTDPDWCKKRKLFAKENEWENNENAMSLRYREWDFLRYIFRGIEAHAPWVHHIYLVTDGQKPGWLDETCDKVSIIDHKDFIPEEYLPTFNSHTIELNLYRIPGLSEQFVYFNDDVLLAKDCGPRDFFADGKPVDEASLNGINGKDNQFAEIQFHNMALMNSHYSVEDCKKNLGKWMRLSYGKNVIRTLLLLPFQRLQGIYNPHGPMPILKDTCRKLWERDQDVLDATCKCRFREGNNVSAYIFRFEQLLSGKFIPKRSQNCYCTVDMAVEEIEKKMKKYKTICINDTELNENAYFSQKEQIKGMLDRIFPVKSSFER